MKLWIPGVPRPQGSMRTFTVAGRAHARHSDSTIDHRNLVTYHLSQQPLRIEGAARLDAEFVFPRPKSHYGTGRNVDTLKPSAPKHHIQPADTDKLLRLLCDAAENAGIVGNDSQFVEVIGRKKWGDAGTLLIIEPYE